MLASRFIELHYEGGPYYTFPLLIMLLANVVLIAYLGLAIISKKAISQTLIEIVKHIGLFAAVWGTLFTMYGLLNAFDAIEGAPEEIPMPVIMGGLKVALITIIYGLVICTLSLFSYILLKLGMKSSNTSSV